MLHHISLLWYATAFSITDRWLGLFLLIKATVQYGKNLQVMVVACNTVGTVRINRTHEIFSSVFIIPLSTGIIKSMVIRCADALQPTYEKICCFIEKLGFIYCDETGTRVDGKTWWLIMCQIWIIPI